MTLAQSDIIYARLITTHHPCGRCTGHKIRNNQSSNEWVNYHWTSYGHHHSFLSAEALAAAFSFSLIKQSLLKLGIVVRAIVSLTKYSISHVNVAKLGESKSKPGNGRS